MDRPERVRWLQDGALAGLLSGMGLLEALLPLSSFLGEGSLALSAACGALITLVLALRRHRPLLTVGVITLAWVVLHLTAPVVVLFWGQFVPLVVATYSVARHGRGRAPWLGAGLTAASLLILDLTVPAMGAASEIVFHWVVCATAWLAGIGLRRFEQRADAASRVASQHERSAREHTVRALAEERARIARELHDVVAHAVSMMVVQAGAAEQVVGEDPERVRGALQTIRSTGQGALSEMRRVVTMLRTDDDAPVLQPQPGLGALADLLAATRRAGLETELLIEGEPRELPAGLDLAVFRIVQESLTNVHRHARATRARVALRYLEDRLDLTVDDDGMGTPASVGGSTLELSLPAGHGLIGMRERASLYGGQFEASAAPGTGFTVRASFPVVSA